MFEKQQFMKAPIPFTKEFTNRNHAPMFRKSFTLERCEAARLSVCGLGIGYYYINGRKVSGDLFTAPQSDYTKTLWYNEYDVTELLQEGENCIAVWLGNGWYNEDFETGWRFDEAVWRDVPKCMLRLEVDGVCTVVSDDSWKCQPDSAIYFNGLRSGEYFDARLYDPEWVDTDYDDSSWVQAVEDDNPPAGVFRKCPCEPIRECRVYACKEVIPAGEGRFIFDFGQNMSGYIRLRIAGEAGQQLTIRYAEQLTEELQRENNDMLRCYHNVEFQTDRFICSGKETVWSPRFAYHGFQYAIIEGLKSSEEITVEAIFVHQDVKTRTEFACSDPFLNELFRAGIVSTYSNMFYAITDCPTREKLGWANDAQASAEQILTDFAAERVLEKWLQDIRDAMREDGALPGIIPTAGWGFHWGNGPVSDGVLFELPYRIYLHTGNAKPLLDSAEHFKRYLAYLDSQREADGFVRFGLSDWACPGLEPKYVPVEMINAVLEYRFCEIAALAAQLGATAGTEAEYRMRSARLRDLVMDTYLTEGGSCNVHHQTAVALLLYYRMYREQDPLKQQLKTLIEEADFHHNCGMVGLRRLFEALNHCGLQEYAYRVLTVGGYPGHRSWFEQGANSLWEKWDYAMKADSKNHQMYSDFMSWMVKTILGIRQEESSTGFARVSIEPYFFEELTFAKGSCDTCAGRVSVSWEKKAGGIQVLIDVPEGMTAIYRKTTRPVELSAGSYSFWAS